jgi:hypothetical protein
MQYCTGPYCCSEKVSTKESTILLLLVYEIFCCCEYSQANHNCSFFANGNSLTGLVAKAHLDLGLRPLKLETELDVQDNFPIT